MALGRLPEIHVLNNGGMVGYFQDEVLPLHHIGVKWIVEEALVRLDRFPGAEFPQSMLVSCIPVRNPIANEEVFRSLVKWRRRPLPLMQNLKAFYIMTYNAWFVGKEEFVAHFLGLKPLLHTDVWILFGANFEDWSVKRFLAEQGYPASMTRNVAIADNLHTATICWNPSAVEITFEDRDAIDSLVLTVRRRKYRSFLRVATTVASLNPMFGLIVERFE